MLPPVKILVERAEALLLLRSGTSQDTGTWEPGRLAVSSGSTARADRHRQDAIAVPVL